MKKIITTIISITALIIFSSCGNNVESSLLESNNNLTNEKLALEGKVLELEAKLKSSKNEEEIIANYLAEKNKSASEEIVKTFWKINTKEVLDTLELDDSDILATLEYGGGIKNVTTDGYDIKRILEESPVFYKKIKNPENIKILYKKNKNIIKKILYLSPTLKKYYVDSDIISKYFAENIDSKKEVVFQSFFDKNNGNAISYNGIFDTSELTEEHMKILNVFDGNENSASDSYLLWLSVKRQKNRFGVKWIKTFSEIVKDFGEI